MAVSASMLAQDARRSKYVAILRAAISTGAVDLVLPPREIALELHRISHHPLVRTISVKRPGDELEVSEEHLSRIFAMLRNATTVDFTHYKQPTIRRRLQRRMVLHKINNI